MLDHTSHRDVLWIVLALLCLYRQLPGTCANNPLQLDPPSIVVRYGDPASANCSTNVAHAGMGWEASQGGVEMKMVQFMTWAVQNVTHWDLKPLCFVNTNESGQKQAKLNITIYKPPDRVSLTIVNHTGPMIAGRHYELQCDVQNVAPVHLLAVNFYKGQDLLDTKYKSNDTKVQVNTSLSLHVSPGRDEYVADYKCEAELDLGPQTPPPTVASDLLTVEVQFPPSKIVELENASVSRGEDVVLKCSSKGNPQIRYRWIYHETSNVRVSDEDGVSLLRINNTSEDNIGTYMCIAYNDLDATNHTVRVDIHGAKATCPLSISPAEKLLEYGTIINLTCDSSVNTTRQSWEYLNQVHNESVLVINSNTVYNRLDWNVRASCHGEFVGLDSCTEHYSVTVYKRPDNVSISAVDHTGPMIQNQNYTLRCDVRNVAPIQFLRVNWYEGKDLVSSKTFKNATKNPDDVSTTLKISPRRHITQYKCEAKLDFGSDLSQVMSFSHDIVVHEKPSIKKLPERVPLFRGYPVHLACEASGFPEPVITWSSGNKTVKRGNLTIDNAGKYTCTASNPAGTDVKTVTAEMKDVTCDLVLMPSELLVEYGDSAAVDCVTEAPSAHKGMGWKASHGAVDVIQDVRLVTWKLDSVVDWDIEPVCFLNAPAWQCQSKLSVTVFKLPDRVSVSSVGHTGPMIEGKPYELQCDVYNIAPVHLLTVNWYKGQHLVAKTWFSDSTKTPVNQSTRFQLSLGRSDDGVRYRCEAELNLGWAKPSSKMASQVLGLTVHYSPQVTSVVEIFNETSEDAALNCTAEANPPPRYIWYSSSLQKEFNIGNPVLPLRSVGSGNYTCTASNGIGSVSKMFVVRVKPRGGNHTTFWAIVGPFVGLAVLMIVTYVSFKTRTRKI